MKFPTESPFAWRRGIRHFYGRPSPARRGRCIAVIAVAFACLFSAGCGPREPRADLVIINGMEPESLDPAILTGVADMRVGNALFEGLTRLDPRTADPVPGLAEHWEITPDGRTYTFHLRSNLVWSTGEPLRAEDVVYSWIRALDPNTASSYASQLFYLKNAEDYNAGKLKDPNQVGVHAPDPLTVRVELNSPTAFFLDLCSFCTLAAVPRQAIERYGDRWLMVQPVPVSGAYELRGWRLGDKIRLHKNYRYWDAANTHCDWVDFLPVSSPTTALNLYETGAADVVWDKDLVPIELMEELLKRHDFHPFPYLGLYFFRFNVTRAPFTDPRVRQALALAIDKARITRKITKGGELPADNFTPPGTARYHAPAGLGYDPERARRLLAEAGFPGGRGFPAFQYIFNAGAGGPASVHAKIAIEMRQMWHDELGIEMELKQLEWSVYLAAQNKLDFDLCRSSWIGDYNDAETFLNMWMSNSGNNRTGWKNARYDELMREADLQTDLARREQLFQAAETILAHDEIPAVPLYFSVGFEYHDETVLQGIYPNILDMHPINAIYKERSASLPKPRYSP